MPSSVPAAKKGLRGYFRTLLLAAGETKVKVTARSLAPEEAAAMGEVVELGDVTAPRVPAGLDRQDERGNLTGFIDVARGGTGEDDADAARDRAAAVLAVLEAGLKADPTAGGTIPGPGPVRVAETGWQDLPMVTPQGTAGQLARLRFQLTWSSHI